MHALSFQKSDQCDGRLRGGLEIRVVADKGKQYN